MSRTACEIAGRHEWQVVLDLADWWPVAVRCTDWECDAYVAIGDERDD